MPQHNINIFVHVVQLKVRQMESHPTLIKYSQTGQDCKLFYSARYQLLTTSRVMALY